MDIPLLFSNDRELNIYFEESNDDWGVKCVKCKSKRSHVKMTRFFKLPDVMILSLQRINQRRRKKNNSKC